MNTQPEKTAEQITLQQAKDEVAKHHGFHDWDNFLSEMADESRTAIVADYTDEAWVIHTELNELIERSEQDRKEIERLKAWMIGYRDDLKKSNVFHQNQGVINSIDKALTKESAPSKEIGDKYNEKEIRL